MRAVLYVIGLILASTIVLGATIVAYLAPVPEGSAGYYVVSGDLLAKDAVFDAAQTSYEKAIAIEPENTHALQQLAILYNSDQKYDEAAGLLRRLRALMPETPQVHYDLAINIVLSIKQDSKGTIEEIEEALDEFRQADSLAPGYEHARENIEFLEGLRKQYYG